MSYRITMEKHIVELVVGAKPVTQIFHSEF